MCYVMFASNKRLDRHSGDMDKRTANSGLLVLLEVVVHKAKYERGLSRDVSLCASYIG
jgi:hypothetical protein